MAGAKCGACQYLSLHLTTCDNRLVVLSVLNTMTGTRSRILALDVERSVMVQETLIPDMLERHIHSLSESHASFYEPLVDVNMVGMGHTLCFLPHEDNNLTSYDFRTKMWEEVAIVPT